MKVLNVPLQKALQGESACTASRLMDEINESHKIEQLNWSGVYSYCPETTFKIVRSYDSLYLKFYVEELNIRAVNTNDQERVWEDSCVEFFCMLPANDYYTNLEFNCIGTCVATTRKGKELDVKPFSEQQLKQIDRCSSLDKTAFEIKNGLSHWELTLKIPFALLQIDANNLPDFVRANFYKCGDNTLNPHYVSWNPILTEQPDFHCPAFFGRLEF